MQCTDENQSSDNSAIVTCCQRNAAFVILPYTCSRASIKQYRNKTK